MFKLYSIGVLVIGVIAVAITYTYSTEAAMAVASGYLVSSILLVSGFWVVDRFKESSNNVFLKAFFISLTVRFIFGVAAVGIILGLTKIHEIYFTVSFIISYLFQSVTEMILFTKILKRNSTKKQ